VSSTARVLASAQTQAVAQGNTALFAAAQAQTLASAQQSGTTGSAQQAIAQVRIAPAAQPACLGRADGAGSVPGLAGPGWMRGSLLPPPPHVHPYRPSLALC
jgi:hypothetical protein